LRNEDRAAVRPGAELGDADPVRLVVVVQPGELELDPGVVVRVVVVRDQRYYDAVDGRAAGGRMPVRRAERGQAKQGTVLPAADHEMRAIALFAEHMTRARQGVLAGELVADDADAHRAAGPEFRISVRHPIGFGEGAGDQLGDRSRRAIHLCLLWEGPVDGREGWTAEVIGQAGGVGV